LGERRRKHLAISRHVWNRKKKVGRGFLLKWAGKKNQRDEKTKGERGEENASLFHPK